MNFLRHTTTGFSQRLKKRLTADFQADAAEVAKRLGRKAQNTAFLDQYRVTIEDLKKYLSDNFHGVDLDAIYVVSRLFVHGCSDLMWPDPHERSRCHAA
jgi:hypothetical protein